MKLWRKIEVRDALSNKLEINFRSGRELTGWFIYKGKKVTRVTVPKGRELLTPGTQKSIRDSLRLNPSEFNGLIECPIRHNEYIDLLKNRGCIN